MEGLTQVGPLDPIRPKRSTMGRSWLTEIVDRDREYVLDDVPLNKERRYEVVQFTPNCDVAGNSLSSIN